MNLSKILDYSASNTNLTSFDDTEHILSNISIEEVMSLSTNDNKLIINSDSSDYMRLDSSQWEQVEDTNEFTNKITVGSVNERTVSLFLETEYLIV